MAVLATVFPSLALATLGLGLDTLCQSLAPSKLLPHPPSIFRVLASAATLFVLFFSQSSEPSNTPNR